jgi:hypothetical protein
MPDDATPSKKTIDARRITTPARPPQRVTPPVGQEPISAEDNPIIPLRPETVEVPEEHVVHRSFRMSRRVADGFQALFDACPPKWTQNQCLESILTRTGYLAPSQHIPGHGAPPRLLFQTRVSYSEKQPRPRRPSS